ncbi:MAG: DUF6265 family protein [Fuerstiella sp.]
MRSPLILATLLKATLIAAVLPSSGTAQEMLTEHTIKASAGVTGIDADLGQFQWLLGEWSGEGFGGQCLESWSPPAGGSMMGTFRLVEGSKLNFCEVFLLSQTDQGVILKLKHFDDQLVGWEAKDKAINFPLLKVEKNTAWFGGLTYQLQKDGSLKAWVAMKKKDGTFREAEIHFQPVAKLSNEISPLGR